MNIHNKFRTIYFARVRNTVVFVSILITHRILQSGPSLIEYSYKADSDLSPTGWDYADRLRDFVLDRRAKSLKARGMENEDRRLVVSAFVVSLLRHSRTEPSADLDVCPPKVASYRLAILAAEGRPSSQSHREASDGRD